LLLGAKPSVFVDQTVASTLTSILMCYVLGLFFFGC
jgi:hypothetical protein